MKTELFHNRLEDVTQFLTRLEETLAARTDLTEENGGMVWVNISEARQILDVIGFVQTLPKYLDLARGECALKFALRVIRKASFQHKEGDQLRGPENKPIKLTPETNSAKFRKADSWAMESTHCVGAQFAEKLERERDEAREIAENLHRWMTESLKSRGQGFLPDKLPWK